MNTVINSANWVDFPVKTGTVAADLRQLINITGPLVTGLAIVMEKVQISEALEDEGKAPFFTKEERRKAIGLCQVSLQLLAEASTQGCEALMEMRPAEG